jgi:hypothetical protein
VRRLVTLILLVLFLLNIIGYYGVFVGLRLSNQLSLQRQFDSENYQNQEVTIKVPIAIPYAVDSKTYERVDGEFEHEGQVYRLVKQKLQSDTLYIVCIKDNRAQKINQVLADYVKSYTDKPFSAKQNAKSISVFSKDFLSTTTSVESIALGWKSTSTYLARKSDLYQFNFNRHIVQPPEA